MQPLPDVAETLDRLLALCEPVRRDLYLFISNRDDVVSRDEAADALGLRRGLVAHHLDRLAADGLLEVEYRRLTGRSGPGTGRPAKLYRRAEREHTLTLPARNPTVMAELLVGTLDRAGERGQVDRRIVITAAREAGRDLGRAAAGSARLPARTRRRAVADVLASFGYVPRSDGTTLTLRNFRGGERLARMAAGSRRWCCAP